MSTKNSSRFTPVIIAISVVIGILIGTFYAKHFAGNRLGIINGSSNKLNALLRIVDDQYVDTVNMTDLVEKAMPQILAELDPHSTYIPAQNLEEVNSELEAVLAESVSSLRYRTIQYTSMPSFRAVLPRK